MLATKLAAISSALAPPFVGRPMKAPAPAPTRTGTPGLGARMREETSRSLESALKANPFQTGLEQAVKAAAGLPTAQIAGASPFMGAMRALPGRMLGGAKRGLGLAALGAGGALAYGLHKQNVQDRENNPLVYAPMQGSVLG